VSAQRDRLTAFARTLDGVGVSAAPLQYRGIVGCTETPERAVELAKLSGCALTVRGLWHWAGVRHPILLAPYRTGRAVADLVEIAQDSYALTKVRDELPPLSGGDVVIVGEPEHVWTVLDATVTDYPEKGTHLIRGLDGGQKDAHGNQCIFVKTHEITGSPPIDGGRHVRYVIDFEAVWRRWGAV
jgi:hypothetical protein